MDFHGGGGCGGGKKYEDLGIKCWGGQYVARGKEPTHLLLNGGVYHVPVDKVYKKAQSNALERVVVSKTEKQCKACGGVYKLHQQSAKTGRIYKSSESVHHEHRHCLLTAYGMFLKNIGDDIDKGAINYISEQKTPIFRMHADLDVLQPQQDEELSLDLLRTWITEMQFVMNDFFGQVEGYVPMVSDTSVASASAYQRLAAVICMAPSKSVDKNKKLWTKTGVHVIWPYIFTNADMAKNIRYGWLQHFEKKFGRRDRNNPWQDVFDMSVYTTNGLRMVGSDKMEKCSSCKGKKAKDNVCAAGICNGLDGQYSENRIYRAVFAVQNVVFNEEDKTYNAPDYDILMSEIQRCGFNEVLFTSIRTAKPAPTPMVLPEWYDVAYFSDEQEKHRSIYNPTPAERTKKREAIGRMTENQESMKTLFANKKRFPATDDECRAVQKWLHDDKLVDNCRIPEVYRNTKIIDLTRIDTDGGYPYYFARVDSSFCMNIRDEHNHNSIYFLINRWGLYQKCFCTCETLEGRAHGLCKKYKSGMYAMPNYVTVALYPMIARKNRQLDIMIASEDFSTLDRESQLELLDLKACELEMHWHLLAGKKKQLVDDKRFQSKRD